MGWWLSVTSLPRVQAIFWLNPERAHDTQLMAKALPAPHCPALSTAAYTALCVRCVLLWV